MKWETHKGQVEFLWKVYQFGHAEVHPLFCFPWLYIAQTKMNTSIHFSVKIATLKETKVRIQYEERSYSNRAGIKILKLQWTQTGWVVLLLARTQEEQTNEDVVMSIASLMQTYWVQTIFYLGETTHMLSKEENDASKYSPIGLIWMVLFGLNGCKNKSRGGE